MAIGIARAFTGIATARATMRTRSARATEFAMTGKVTPAWGHFKRPHANAAPHWDVRIGFTEDEPSLHALMLLGIAAPACLLFADSVILFSKRRSAASWLQVISSTSLMVVGPTHLAEAFDLIAWMQWGAEGSAGHYLDLGSAILAVPMFPIGYPAHALVR